jgi:uncharacterized protein YfkK (UPF0435 family)
MFVPEPLKKSIRVIVFLMFISAVSLGIFEFGMRIFSYTPSFPMFDYTLLFDEEIIFRIKPNSAPDINEMGYRGSNFDRENKNKVRRVLFLGDSFVMGHNVKIDETIAANLNRNLGAGYEVLNMGVLAYGPDQSLLALLEDGLDLNPDMVILGVFAANDFQDIDHNGLFSVDEGGRLIRNPENVLTREMPASPTLFMFYRTQGFLQPRIDKNYRYLSRRYEFLMSKVVSDFYDWDLLFFPDLETSKDKVDVMRAILMRFKEELNSKNIVFSVVNMPSYLNIVNPSEFEDEGVDEEDPEAFEKAKENDFFGPEDIVIELCENLRIPYLNLYPEFLEFDDEGRAALYDDEDWHLSAWGNRFSGELVATELVRPLLPPPDWEINQPLRSRPQRPWI